MDDKQMKQREADSMDDKQMKKKPRRTLKQNLALAAIVLLVLMYLLNLILALIGSEFTQNLLKATMVMTIALPILLYGMLVVMQGASKFRRKPEDELTEDEKAGYYQMLEERDEKRIAEQTAAREARKAKSKKAGKH